MTAVLSLRAALGFACASWLLACALFCSYAAASILLPRVDLLTRLTATMAVTLWLAQVAFHLLAGVGWFNLPVAMIAATALAAIAYLYTRRSGALVQALNHDGRALQRLRRRRGGPGQDRWQDRGRDRMWFLFAVIACAVVGRCLVMPVLGWDTLVYHAVKPALWVQTGTYEAWNPPGGWSVFLLHPSASEVLIAWAMLPFHGDVLAGVDGFVWLGLGLAVVLLGRRLGLREPHASAAAIFVLAVPTARLLVGSGYAELTLSLSLVLALTFAIRYLQLSRPGDLLVAFALLGVLAGTKVTMIALLGLVGLVLAIKAVAGKAAAGTATASRGRAVGLVLVGVAAAALPYAPWLLRNLSTSGYPLSPVPLRIGGVTLGRSNQTVEALAALVAGQPAWDWERERRIVKALFALPGVYDVGFGALALVPVLLALVGWVVLARKQLPVALLTFLVCAAFLGLYFNRQVLHIRAVWTTNSARFLLPFVCVAVPVSLTWCRSRRQGRPGGLSRVFLTFVWGAAIFNLVWYAVAGWSVHDTQGVVALVALGAAACALVHRAAGGGRRTATAVALGCGLVTVLGLDVYKRHVRYDAIRESAVFDGNSRYWWRGAQALDQTPDRPPDQTPGGHRIAVTSGPQTGGDWFAYHFLGASFQNRIDYVSPAPSEQPVQVPYADAASPLASFPAWLARLRARGLTHVVSFRPPSIELRWMEQQPTLFHRIDGVPGNWGLFALVPDPAAVPSGSAP
jgi:hypothetical protein